MVVKETLAEVLIFRAANKEDALRVAHGDPAVQRKLWTATVLPWGTQKGVLQPLTKYDPTVNYYLGFLKRGAKFSPEDSPERQRIQDAHLKNIGRLHDMGKLVAAGPFLEDTDLRGIFVFKTATMEEANELTNTDPAVQAGRLRIELYEWKLPAGGLSGQITLLPFVPALGLTLLPGTPIISLPFRIPVIFHRGPVRTGGGHRRKQYGVPGRIFQGVQKHPMKRTLARFVLPMVLLSVTALAQTGSAAPAPAATGSTGNKVGIINIQQAIQMTNEGKRDLEALDKKFEPQRNTLQNLQKEVQAMQDQLKTQGDKLNEEARAKLVRDIETKQKSLQRQLEDAQGEYQGAQGELVNRVGGKLMEVLDKYAKANGYSIILDVSNPQSPVLWASAPIDVTQEIATAYNASSNVPAPANTPAAPSATARPGGVQPHSAATTGAKTTPK